MPPQKRRIPKYRHYKPKDLAVVRLDGKDHYLGKYDSAKSRERYHRLIAEWLENGRIAVGSPARERPPEGFSVGRVILRYWRFALQYYRKHGVLTGETDNIRAALKPVRRLYGSLPAEEFDSEALETVRNQMIRDGLSRGVVNSRVRKIRAMFQWAVTKRLVPGETYYSLGAVRNLQRGRFSVRETEPVKPVSDEHVDATVPYLNRYVRTMVEVQRLTGMRPQDIRNIRTCDVDTNGEVWTYRPWTHKTEHLGHTRQIAVGPLAQRLLQPFLMPDDPTAFIFSPKKAEAARRQEQRQRRRTPVQPSQQRRKPKRNPKRSPGEQYTKSSYLQAIARVCEKAGVPRWSPNQLRHNCATKVRQRYGIEATAAVLGNSLGMVAEVYAESAFQKAVEVMREIG